MCDRCIDVVDSFSGFRVWRMGRWSGFGEFARLYCWGVLVSDRDELKGDGTLWVSSCFYTSYFFTDLKREGDVIDCDM